MSESLKRVWRELRTRGFRVTARKVRERIVLAWKTRTVARASGFDPRLVDPAAPLAFPTVADPTISIIVPVYNQWAFTRTCLGTLRLACGPYTFEVLLADDGSTDETRQYAPTISGLRLLFDGSNRGFLRNCNHAVAQAKGRYVVLLNNDTQCAADALAVLVEALESNHDLGIVGALLLNVDGTVQDAGGCLWRDGSAGNLGRHDHPDVPAYRFRRDVDYVTGACLALSRDLWNRLGGFDERYVPAYAEDTDLSLRVRALGLRTVVEPRARVLHYEGVSHGRRLDTGLKAHQVTNLRRLAEQWSSVFAGLPLADDRRLRARDRLGEAPLVLVVDRQVPTPERDAGSACTLQYITSLRELGCRVTFFALEGPRHSSVTLLEEQGVEVVAGPGLGGNWNAWLAQYGTEIDVAILNRPGVASAFLPILKTHRFQGKMVYLGHDLHFVRFQREAELPGQPRAKALIAEAQRWRSIEACLHREADEILAITREEAALVEREFHRTPHLFPGFRYGAPAHPPSLVGRDGMLFVGGFSHEPNRDAMVWFCAEILPAIRQKLPKATLSIIGAGLPPELARVPGVCWLGAVDGGELSTRLAHTRVVLLPLRFGAGLKGKLLQALSEGLPVVGTRIALEGLSVSAQANLQPADTTEDFVARTLLLLRDDAAWTATSAIACRAAEEFTPAASRRSFDELLKKTAPHRIWNQP